MQLLQSLGPIAHDRELEVLSTEEAVSEAAHLEEVDLSSEVLQQPEELRRRESGQVLDYSPQQRLLEQREKDS